MQVLDQNKMFFKLLTFLMDILNRDNELSILVLISKVHIFHDIFKKDIYGYHNPNIFHKVYYKKISLLHKANYFVLFHNNKKLNARQDRVNNHLDDIFYRNNVYHNLIFFHIESHMRMMYNLHCIRQIQKIWNNNT